MNKSENDKPNAVIIHVVYLGGSNKRHLCFINVIPLHFAKKKKKAHITFEAHSAVEFFIAQ